MSEIAVESQIVEEGGGYEARGLAEGVNVCS